LVTELSAKNNIQAIGSLAAPLLDSKLHNNNNKKKREWATILHISQQNGFPPSVIHKLRHRIEHKKEQPAPHDNENKKWATFTYISPQIQRSLTYSETQTSR